MAGRPGSGLDGPPASFGRRTVAFLLDAVGSGLVARLLDPLPASGALDASAGLTPVVVLAVVYVAGLVLLGQTPGMRLLGLRVEPVSGDATRVALVPAALRTALLLLLVPAVISDSSGRGLHDKAAGTVVVRARRGG